MYDCDRKVSTGRMVTQPNGWRTVGKCFTGVDLVDLKWRWSNVYCRHIRNRRSVLAFRDVDDFITWTPVDRVDLKKQIFVHAVVCYIHRVPKKRRQNRNHNNYDKSYQSYIAS